MASHSFKKGDRVVVLNTTMSGTVIIEGRATIWSAIRGVDERYFVKFDTRQADLEPVVERFVDPLAQARPDWYVADLNAGFITRAAS